MSPSEEIENLTLSEWAKERGWEKVGENKAKGTYKNDELGEFDGIVKSEHGRLKFYIRDLPSEIQNTSHAGCFKDREGNLWKVHFMKGDPDSVIGGIRGIEDALRDAAEATEES